MPYGVYYSEGTDNFAADGIAYATATRYTLELYTDEKSPETEKRLEAALTCAGIFWNKTSAEAWLDSEQMMLVPYEIEV